MIDEIIRAYANHCGGLAAETPKLSAAAAMPEAIMLAPPDHQVYRAVPTPAIIDPTILPPSLPTLPLST